MSNCDLGLKFPPTPYNLYDKPQVDPGASLSLGYIGIRYPSLAEIRKKVKQLLQEHPFPNDPDNLEADIRELIELEGLRTEENKIASQTINRVRKPLSIFLLDGNLDNKFYKEHKVADSHIKTGENLARRFENDTTLLGGWMALNYLLAEVKKPPTEQAFIWAALSMAVNSALLAAWHYKWMEPSTRLKPRPSEVYPKLTVLYKTDKEDGNPRHPSYPSGHSTVGGATSAVLKYFFGNEKHSSFCTDRSINTELDNLADNAGLARMWAGIHYRADHEFGLALGAAVAELVLRI